MRLLATGLFLLGVAACSTREGMDIVDPILLEHRERVEVKDSERAREKVGEEIRAKQEWSVQDCIDLACLHNDRLRARGETYYQAVLARDIITAAALPSVTARATYYRQETSPGFGSAQGFSLRARDEEFLRMEVPIFAGFREWNARSGATEEIEAEAAALRHQKGLIAVLVVEAFYSVLRTQRSLATIEGSLVTQRARRTEMDARSKAGIARKTELLLVESQLASTESSRARAANDLMVARARLASLLGVTAGRPLQDEPYDQAPEAVETLLKRAEEKRADLAELQRRIRAAEARVDVEWGAWLPTVQATGNVWQHRDGSSEEVDWDFLLEAELNLFAGGGTRARISDAKSRVRQAEFELSAQKVDVALLVRQEYHAWHSLDETIKSLQKEVAATEENFKLLQEEYKQKIASNLEVQIAQDLLLQAQLALEAARLDRK
ncbi:MAG TPA: TolC family protein, partial [Planctomycetota bacterium]|nr:TolC family protein [Planctomycetota bacterium]